MTLLESAVRLALSVTVLIWLPGWVVARHPLWPLRVLHPMVLGMGIHLFLFVICTTISARLERAPVLLLTATAITVVGLAIRRRRVQPSPGEAHGVRLSGIMLAAVGACVALAATLRWFHNYNFDDFQHLIYLTEVERLGVLFPRQFMLHVDWGDLMGRVLIVSRYPFWAAEYAALSAIAGVPVGDAYYLLGLGFLALTLGLITALLHDVLSSRTGSVSGLTALLAGAHLFTGADLLNFGGYPFQSGKLLVLASAVACLAYWRCGRPVYLLYAGIGLFAAPLLHTNNIVGVSVVLTLAAAAAAIHRSTGLRLLAVGAVSVAAVLLLGVISTVAGGFLQLSSPSSQHSEHMELARTRVVDVLPDNPAARMLSGDGRRLDRSPRVAAPRLVARLEHYNIVEYDGWHYGIPGTLGEVRPDKVDLAEAPGVIRDRSREAVELEIARVVVRGRDVDEAATGSAGNIRGRLMLFLKRAMPLELLLVGLVVVLYVGFGVHSALAPVVARAVFVVCAVVVVTNSARALTRQVATVTFKPGYLNMRASIEPLKFVVPGERVLTDPITRVFGNASGWRLPEPPHSTPEEQFRPLLMFHPVVRGEVLEHLWASEDRTLIVINEAVVGPGVAAKFEELKNVARLRTIGNPAPSARTLTTHMEAVVRQLYALDYVAARRDLATSARLLWQVLFNRPVYVLAASPLKRVSQSENGAFAEAFERASQTAGLTSAKAGAIEQRPFLNTVLFRAGVSDGCFTDARIQLDGEATFSSPVLIHALPTGRNAVHGSRSAYIAPNGTLAARLPFTDPVCGPGDVTFFVHGGHHYDFRFRVRSLQWYVAPTRFK